MPVLNGERFINEALDSVFAQNISTIEMIVVDDGSTDDTSNILKSRSEPVKIARTANVGPAGARNEGFRLARGRFIAFLDSDDYWSGNNLLTHLNAMENDPQCDLTLGRLKYHVMPDSGEKNLKYQFDDGSFYGYQLGAGLYRKEIFDVVGLFDESLRLAEDVDWLMRARDENVRIRHLDFISLNYRRHSGNMTRHQPAKAFGFTKVFKRSLDRRRKKGQEKAKMPKLSDVLER